MKVGYILEDINYTRELELLWQTDEEFQMKALRGIVKHIRHVSDEHIQDLQAQYLRDLKAFYVPTDMYMTKFFGSQIMDIKRGIYTANQYCYLAERLAIPIRLMNNQVIGFIGYSNQPEDWPMARAWIKYRYPDFNTFKKDRYMFIEPEEYKRAVQEGYICIVDGLFDKMILQALGINAVSLCGSSLTTWHKKYLAFIPNIIVIGDNDNAGRLLYEECKKCMPRTVEIRQPFTGDIDDYLKSQERIKILLATIEEMKRENFILSKVIKGEPKSYGRTSFFKEAPDSSEGN